LLNLYATDIYGRVPKNAPKATYQVLQPGTNVMGGLATAKLVLIRFGDKPDSPEVYLHMYLPAQAHGPVPMLLHLVFFSNLPMPGETNPAPPFLRGRPAFRETGPLTNILARGYGYATVRYSEIQPDNSNTFHSGVIGLTRSPGQTNRAPDSWGTISAWAWGASRVLDYFQTDPAVDAKHVALIGHSRLGKTVLWAGAQDPRFAVIFSSCAGEMGSALARRDFGETIDDMAANFPWQFAVNFQKYPGHWNDMPVDAHMIIVLNAPHPVFISGGTGDLWSDPRGEFLAEVAAGPVYRLVGKKDLGITNGPTFTDSEGFSGFGKQDLGKTPGPPLDTPLITGDLGFNYHTGGHTITPSDWAAFLDFADKYFKEKNP